MESIELYHAERVRPPTWSPRHERSAGTTDRRSRDLPPGIGGAPTDVGAKSRGLAARPRYGEPVLVPHAWVDLDWSGPTPTRACSSSRAPASPPATTGSRRSVTDSSRSSSATASGAGTAVGRRAPEAPREAEHDRVADAAALLDQFARAGPRRDVGHDVGGRPPRVPLHDARPAGARAPQPVLRGRLPSLDPPSRSPARSPRPRSPASPSSPARATTFSRRCTTVRRIRARSGAARHPRLPDARVTGPRGDLSKTTCPT